MGLLLAEPKLVDFNVLSHFGSAPLSFQVQGGPSCWLQRQAKRQKKTSQKQSKETKNQKSHWEDSWHSLQAMGREVLGREDLGSSRKESFGKFWEGKFGKRRTFLLQVSKKTQQPNPTKEPSEKQHPCPHGPEHTGERETELSPCPVFPGSGPAPCLILKILQISLGIKQMIRE